MTSAARKAALAKVHIAVTQLGLDDATYRGLLGNLFAGRDAGRAARWGAAQPSAKDLTPWELRELLEHFRARGFAPTRPARAGRSRPAAKPSREALLSRIEAHLAEARRPPAYADAMARRMFKVDAYTWLDADRLWRLTAALEVDARRQGRATERGSPR